MLPAADGGAERVADADDGGVGVFLAGASSSLPRIVAISFCIKAHGTVEPRSGHFSPLGQ